MVGGRLANPPARDRVVVVPLVQVTRELCGLSAHWIWMLQTDIKGILYRVLDYNWITYRRFRTNRAAPFYPAARLLRPLKD